MEKRAALIIPTIEFQEQYMDFYFEWKQSGEDMIPWVIQKDPSDFTAMLEFLENNSKGEKLPEGWVPDSTFWLVDSKEKVVGAVNIRHSLTENLLYTGGHIGYGIRPTERKKGFATQILSLSLEKARELGMARVLVVCDEGNIGSERTILKNGGVRDEDYIEEDGNVIRRYWISL
ncbi:MAG: GNAT family N-acetyltransferase [Bacillota bacterium]